MPRAPELSWAKGGYTLTSSTGESITFTPVVKGLDDLQAYFSAQVTKHNNISPLFKSYQALMYRSFNSNFLSNGRPRPWADLLAQTMKRKRKMGKAEMLRISGRLRLSCISEIEKGNVTRRKHDSITMGTTVPYAKFLQYGTKHMPARPFIMVQKEDAEEMQRLAAEFSV